MMLAISQTTTKAEWQAVKKVAGLTETIASGNPSVWFVHSNEMLQRMISISGQLTLAVRTFVKQGKTAALQLTSSIQK